MAGSVHEDKRTGKWFYAIEVGKDPITGRRKQKKKSGFKNKTEARKAMIAAEKDFNEGILIKSSKILVKDFIIDWLETKKAHNNIGKQTSKVYEDYIRKYIIPYIGGIYISDITKVDIQNKIINKMNLSDYAPATIGKTVRILKTSLDYAVDFELIKKNPCVKLILPQKKKSKSEIKVWNIGEVNTFLSLAKEYQYYPVFHLALNTGMRQQEILGLSWDNVNFEKSTISIRQVLSHDGKEIINSTKTENSERTINVSDSTMNLLMKLKHKLDNDKKKYDDIYQDNNLVICTETGTPINPRNLLRSFYSLTEKAKLPKITFHDLRHTYATLLLENGVNIKVISERLGHSRVAITLDIYSHVSENMQLEAVKAMDNLINN